MYGPGYGFGAAGRSRRHRAAGASSPTPTPTPTPAPNWSSGPLIAGAGTPPRVGDVLTATGGTITTGTHSGWQWLRDDITIEDAEASSYELVTDDIGALIVARELATNSGVDSWEDSEPIGPVEDEDQVEEEVDAEPTAAFTLSQFPSYDEKRIFQRTTMTGGGEGKGQGSIIVPLSGTVTAGTVSARIRSAEDDAILQGPWIATKIEDDATEVEIADVDARLGWFHVDLKGADGDWQLGTVAVSMGALTVFAGQSLMVRMLGRQNEQTGTYASLGITPNANGAVLATYHDGDAYSPTVATMPWMTPEDGTNGSVYNSVGVGEFLNRMIALTGVNCGVIGAAEGGASIASFFPGRNNNVRLEAILTRAGSAFEAFIWGQGHAEAYSGTPPKAYAAMLDRMLAPITALNRLASYGKYIWTIPSKGLGNDWGTPWQSTQIRKGAQDWCAANGGTYVHADDALLGSDGVHQAQAGSITIAQHCCRAMRAQYGASSGIGPRPLSATRSGTTITLTLSDEGQSNLVLSGSPGNRIFVFPRGRVNPMGASATANRFPVSSVSVVNKTTLSVTLANDPGAGHELDLWVYWPSGPANAATDTIRDDQLDDLLTGRIVQANVDAIRISAPTPAGTVNAPPGGFVDPISPFSMVETSPTFASSDGGANFGQQMTGGRARAVRTPLFVPITVEGFFTCPNPLPSDIEVMFGGFGPYGSCFVALEANGKVRGWDISAVSTTILAPGKRYHIACQAGPGGLALYITNVTDGSAGTREYHSAYSGTVDPGGSTFALRNLGGSFALSGGAVDEWAVFNCERYSGASYTCPTTPFTGEETDIVALYRCDGDATDEVAK
jgi:hypothetical protein